MNEKADKLMMNRLSATLEPEVCNREMWGYIGTIDGQVYAESAITLANFSSSAMWTVASPLLLESFVSMLPKGIYFYGKSSRNLITFYHYVSI